MSWTYQPTPGRPAATKFLLQYRIVNSSRNWIEYQYEGNGRVRRSAVIGGGGGGGGGKVSVSIMSNVISNEDEEVEFQVSSVSENNRKSNPSKPIVYVIGGKSCHMGIGYSRYDFSKR